MITDKKKINELLNTNWDEQIEGITVFINSGYDVICMCQNNKDGEIYYQIDIYSTEEEQVYLYDINSFDREKIPSYVREDIIFVKDRATAYSVFNNLMLENSAI